MTTTTSASAEPAQEKKYFLHGWKNTKTATKYKQSKKLWADQYFARRAAKNNQARHGGKAEVYSVEVPRDVWETAADRFYLPRDFE